MTFPAPRSLFAPRRWVSLITIASALALVACDVAGPAGRGGAALEYDASGPLRITPDGKQVISAVGSQLHIVNVQGARLETSSGTTYHRLEIKDVAVTRDRSLIAAGGYRTIHVQNGYGPTGGGGIVKDLTPAGMIWSLDFSPDKQLLATSIGVYDTKSYSLVYRLAPDVPEVRDAPAVDKPAAPEEGKDRPPLLASEQAHLVRFSDDGRRLFVAGPHGVHIIEVGAWRTLGVYPLGTLSLLPDVMAMSGDRKLVVAHRSGPEARLFTVEDTGLTAKNLFRLPEGIRAAAFSPDGKRLALASRRKLVVVDPDSGIEVSSQEIGGSGEPIIVRMAWHPVGYIVASKTDNSLAVIDVKEK